ncbi:hypothetical protein B0J18DRAFT_452219 [Chaetomium sp. MPI-SDFR-AT-0129]|nr:hypothetical protein B0J18DRAFT_452219 [Chaetomium sp. MPI-SDFR-AT-0129]
MSGRNVSTQGSARRNPPSNTNTNTRNNNTTAPSKPRTSNRPTWADLAHPMPPLSLETPFLQAGLTSVDIPRHQASLTNTIRVQDLHKQRERFPDCGTTFLVVLTNDTKRERDLCFNAVVARMNARKPGSKPLRLCRFDQQGWPGKGDQAYEGTGAARAVNRVFTALGPLLVHEGNVKMLKDNKIGTILVCAVDDFIVRLNGKGMDPATRELVKEVPADWGYLTFCRVKLAADPGWTWTSGITQGAPVPLNHCSTAMKGGWVDDSKTVGKLSIGSVIGDDFKAKGEGRGWDDRDWQGKLIGKSWYDILEDALGKIRIPL